MPLVNENEIDRCAGVFVNESVAKLLKIPQSSGDCTSRIPLRVQGYDDRWRCPGCHKIHVELVYADTRQKEQKVHD
jgi:transposase-like protein